MADEPQIKLLQIKDPTWVGYLAGPISDYCDRVKIPSIRYETLYSYLVQTVQFGGSVNELWIAHYEGDYKPIAFCNWYVKGLPHVGAAEIGHLYSWNRARVPVGLLIDQFLKFAHENRCTLYTGDLVNEAVWRVVQRAATERGLSITKTERINFYATRTTT